MTYIEIFYQFVRRNIALGMTENHARKKAKAQTRDWCDEQLKKQLEK